MDREKEHRLTYYVALSRVTKLLNLEIKDTEGISKNKIKIKNINYTYSRPQCTGFNFLILYLCSCYISKYFLMSFLVIFNFLYSIIYVVYLFQYDSQTGQLFIDFYSFYEQPYANIFVFCHVFLQVLFPLKYSFLLFTFVMKMLILVFPTFHIIKNVVFS